MPRIGRDITERKSNIRTDKKKNRVEYEKVYHLTSDELLY
jgi:hypothetical protein